MKIHRLLLPVAGLLCITAAQLPATNLFTDDFEGYTAGSTLGTGTWGTALGPTSYRTVQDDTSSTFESLNQYAKLADTGTESSPTAQYIRLQSPDIAAASGALTTFSFDFYEPSSGGASSMGFGYATTGADLNTGGSRIRLFLNNGTISGTGFTASANTYSLETAYTIYVIFNDTASPETYDGGTIAAGSADVWLEVLGSGTPVYAGNAVVGNSQTASYSIGFRTFNGDVQEMWVDNVSLATGVVLPGATPPPPVIGASGQPQSQDVVEGTGLISLSVTASGTGPFTYQWKLDGVDVTGATQSTLEIDTPDSNEAGDYTVVVSGPGGDTTSDPATVTLVSRLPALVDDFDTYGTGFLEALGTDWIVNLPGYYSVIDGGGGDNYLACLDDDGLNTDPSLKPLGSNAIAEGETSTFFSRVYRDSTADGSLWFGLATNDTDGFNAFEGYVTFSSSGSIGLRDGGSNTIATVSLTTDSWHNVWVIHNNETDTYQVFLTTEDRDATLADRLVDSSGKFEFAFRNGTTGSISYVQAISRTTTGAWGVDKLCMSPLANLALPATYSTACSISCSHPAVAEGGTVTVNWNAPGAPAGSTFEITSNATVTFSNGSETGDATTGSGQVDITLVSIPANPAIFSIVVRDDNEAILCQAQTQAEVFDYSAPAQLPHPSVTSSAGQMAFMRDQVLNYPASLAKAGWDAMLATSWASLSYVHTPQTIVSVVPSGTNASETAFRNDTQAVRSHALQWAVTGDSAHRDKALAILSDMGRTFEDMVSTGSSAQVQLESAWALPVWLSAADIMRYHDGGAANWNPADIASFNRFARKLYDYAKLAMSRQNNWGVSASLAVMCYGAWSDDPAIFQTGLNNQLGLLDSISQTDGYIEETCRDVWHPQYSVVSWVDSAELARNLGHLDLYEATFNGQTTPRLAIILEYFANLMLGNTTHPCGGSWAYDYVGAYNRFDNYEVAYNHYLNREGVTYLPVFAEMIEDFWRNDVGDDSHFLLWSRLTHGDNAYIALPPPDTYEQWVAEQLTAFGVTDPFLTASDSDYNNDGISNALHYWTLTNPRAGTYESVFSTSSAQISGELRVRFVERPEAASYGRTFLFSPDLDAWSEASPTSLQLIEDRGDQVVREATFPASGDSGFFRITYPQP